MRKIPTAQALLLLGAVCLALLLGACGSSGGVSESGTATAPAPAATEARIETLTVTSEAVGRPLPVSVIEPADDAPGKRPLLVFLHGAGGSHQSFLGNEAVLDGLAALGDEAPVLAFPEGGLSWWHTRSDGEWDRYVVEEAIPAVIRRFGTDPRRVAVGGISMGGFGAYHLGLAYPKRFCAVGGHSSGLWTDPAAEFPGAFDNADDASTNDVLARVEADPDAFGPTEVWNDYGTEDWFVPGNEAFVAAIEPSTVTSLTAHAWPGGHDGAYWDAHWPQYLSFYAKSLANC